MNILIVEDKQKVRENLFNLLSQMGHSVECAVNGLDALGKIQQNEYDLFVIDHLMPLMNGAQLSKNLKQNHQYKNTPILFMTTQGIEVAESLPESQLFSAIINKPIDEALFLKLISQLSNNELPTVATAANE